MGRSRHRSEVELRRKRDKDEARARETQADQKLAAFRAEYQKRHKQKILGWVLLVGVAPLLFVSHFFAHAGVFRPYSPALQDLTIGWPTAGLLAIVGAILLGRDYPSPPR